MPKTNKEILKHVSKCIGFWIKELSGDSQSPLSMAQIKDLETSRDKGIAIMLSAFAILSLITHKMADCLHQIEDIVTE